jgi:hypothetical protein
MNAKSVPPDQPGIAVMSRQWPERAMPAVTRLLESPDVARDVDHLFPLLLHNMGLLIAFDNIERAGGDLDRLTVSGEVYRGSEPLSYLLPSADERGGRVALSTVRAQLLRHKNAQRDAAIELLASRGSDDVMVISGLAFSLLYPGYRSRMSYDADFLSSDLLACVELGESMAQDHGYGVNRVRASGLGRADACGWVALRRLTQDGYIECLGLIGGGYVVHNGIRLFWSLMPVWERSRLRESWGIVVRVPSTEDLYLMCLLRTLRKDHVVQRDFDDLNTVLTAEGASMDWDYVHNSIDRYRMGNAVRLLFAAAERAGETGSFPREAMPPGQTRVTWQTSLAASAAAKAQVSSWLALFLLSRLGLRGLLGFYLDSWIRGGAFRIHARLGGTNSWVGRTLDPVLRRMRPGFGSLCEHTTNRVSAKCNAWRPFGKGIQAPLSKPRDVQGFVRLVRLVEAHATEARNAPRLPHACWRFLYDVDLTPAPWSRNRL